MEPSFNTDRHVKFYLRCLKTFLPAPYVSNDSNRMLLAYLTLSGLDVLGVLREKTTPEERQGYIDWIYHCQVPSGGFRGFSGTDFGAARRTTQNEAWDPANVPATFFALVNLLILGDDLTRVERRACLQWLPRLQRADGSFGEVLGVGGNVEGGPLLHRVADDTRTVPLLSPGSRNFETLVGWLASRQTDDLGENEDDDSDEEGRTRETGFQHEHEQPVAAKAGSIEDHILDLPAMTPFPAATIPCAGFNGRCNKVADTCYSFWNGATLMVSRSIRSAHPL
ncbi:Terpenoid cyclases/protein prenyltransferase alpha-alpha toroid [Penicillium capsulatum]|nr:Terpenoid cyclases/protein prenyltransferase alpha-alpha toroid [Penicillium capsulatum]